jgi:hypothetical protein
MHWEILIIPLIALGVWILGTLFKGEDERNKKTGRRPGGSLGRPAPQRPVTDLDRFLEEARRRREAEERQRPAPPPPRPTVSRPPLRERPSRPRAVTPRPAPPVLRVTDEAITVPVARPVMEMPVAETPLPVPRQAIEAPPPPPPATPATVTERRPSPILQQVRMLLSKPQTAGTAFVLREIFDRPRCQRRR